MLSDKDKILKTEIIQNFFLCRQEPSFHSANIFFFHLLCLFHFYKNTKIQNTFTNIILHKKFMKLKEEKNI